MSETAEQTKPHRTAFITSAYSHIHFALQDLKAAGEPELDEATGDQSRLMEFRLIKSALEMSEHLLKAERER